MNPLVRRSLYVLLAGLVLISAARTSQAQDAAKVDPEHYKVLYEDADVRVLRYDDQPGHFVPRHSHPEYVVYSLAPARRQFLLGNCASQIAAKPVPIPVNTPLVKSPVTHCERNSGTTDTHLIIIEFKGAKKPAPTVNVPRRRVNKSTRRTPR